MTDALQKKLAQITAVVLDFDGTLTDGFVYVSDDGSEQVRCSRRDGLGIQMLKEVGLKVMVLSKERSKVVLKRCFKLEIECHQSVDDKLKYLSGLFPRGLAQVLYVGDDINDIECIKAAGVGATVADGHPACKDAAAVVTSRVGGDHAVREVCDLILDARR